jgi:hypothetical protein
LAEIPGSILEETKKMLGLAADYSPFDTEIMLHINGTLSKLDQLGVGPEDGPLMIIDNTATWVDLIGDDHRLNQVKTFVGLSVKLVFDPPQVGVVLTAMKEQIQEQEWRLTQVLDTDRWDAARARG